MVRLTRLAAALSLAIAVAGLSPAFSQQPSAPPPAPAPAPTAPTPGTTTPTPGRGTTNPQQQQQQQNPFEIQRPIFLSGKVMLDDGTPPPLSVVIERVCNGNPRAEAHTDSKGRFSFQLGGSNAMMQDASMSSADNSFGGFGTGASARNTMGGMNNSGVSERDMMNCEIRASLPGYRSDSIPLGGRRAFDNPELGTIVLHRMGNVEGVTISAVSMRAPKDAKKAYDKGRELLGKKKIPEAQKEFEKAVQLYPQYSTAWFDLGRTLEAQKDIDGALKSYTEALTHDPKYVFPHRQLMGIYVNQQKWQEAADSSAQLAKLNPFEFPEAFFYNSVANYYLKNYEAAEQSIREAQKLDTRNKMPKTSQLLGAILIEKQDYAGAAEQIRKYLSILPPGQNDESARNQLTELERIVGVKAPAQ